jgi:hypothetical protein
MGKFKIGDKVCKPKGYAFDGIVVAVFNNTNGDVRIVAELEGNGMLHIFSESQLELREEAEKIQTAVDFFMNSLAATSYSNDFWKAYEKAKAMEKGQMIDFGNGCIEFSFTTIVSKLENSCAEQYYNETYGE